MVKGDKRRMTETKEDKSKRLKSKRIKEVETGIIYEVIGDTEVHTVIFNKFNDEVTCDCKYYNIHREDCSHILNVKEKLNWGE